MVGSDGGLVGIIYQLTQVYVEKCHKDTLLLILEQQSVCINVSIMYVNSNLMSLIHYAV